MPVRVVSLLRRVVDLREGEAAAALWAFVYFFCLLSSYYVLRPVRDAMGIAGGVDNLPWLFTATFVTMLAAVPAFGALVARLPRRVLVPLVYHGFVAMIGVFFVLFALDVAPAWVARVFFVWLSVFNLFVVSVFWSYMADIFDHEQGERLFPFVAAGGTVGAIAGPGLTSWLAGALGVAPLLIVAAALLEAAAVCAICLGRRARDRGRGDERIGGGVLAGIRLALRSPYLLGICGYILFMTVTATFVYFEQAHVVERELAEPAAQTAFFAKIDLAANGLTLALQLAITGRLLERFGPVWALLSLPVVTAIGLVALWLVPTLAVVAVFQAVRRATNYGVARPARELLFTVVTREEKYKAKNAIDTVVYRGGDAAAGWAYAGVTALGVGAMAAGAYAAPLALGWAALAVVLGRAQRRRADETN